MLGGTYRECYPEELQLKALAATLEAARIHGAYAGLHCCAARPFARICRVQPDIISFDAYEGLDSFFSDWHVLDFMQQGGTVAYSSPALLSGACCYCTAFRAVTGGIPSSIFDTSSGSWTALDQFLCNLLDTPSAPRRLLAPEKICMSTIGGNACLAVPRRYHS